MADGPTTVVSARVAHAHKTALIQLAADAGLTPSGLLAAFLGSIDSWSDETRQGACERLREARRAQLRARYDAENLGPDDAESRSNEADE